MVRGLSEDGIWEVDAYSAIVETLGNREQGCKGFEGEGKKKKQKQKEENVHESFQNVMERDVIDKHRLCCSIRCTVL